MTTADDRWADLLSDAAAEIKAAGAETATLRAQLPGLLVERQEYERGQRRLMRAIAAIGAAVLVVLVYLIPLANRNARNLDIAAESLDIIKSVTGPDGQAKAQAATGVAICTLISDNHVLHGLPPIDCTPPAEPSDP